MTFKQFIKGGGPFDCHDSQWYIVTLTNGYCAVLQWERGSGNWFKPLPLEGREKVGYLGLVMTEALYETAMAAEAGIKDVRML